MSRLISPTPVMSTRKVAVNLSTAVIIIDDDGDWALSSSATVPDGYLAYDDAGNLTISEINPAGGRLLVVGDGAVALTVPTVLYGRELLGDLTFVRPSVGTYNLEGVVTDAAANVLRYPHRVFDSLGVARDTVRLDGAGTNLYTISEPVTTDMQTRSGVADATGMAAFGLANGIRFPGTEAALWAYRAHTLAPSTVYSMSAFVVMDDGLPPVVGLSSGVGDFSINLGGSATGLGGTLRYENWGGGLWRVMLEGATTSASPSTSCGIVRYINQSRRPFRVSGFDIRAGASAGMYVRSLTGTRSADLASYTIPPTMQPLIIAAARGAGWYVRFVEGGTAQMTAGRLWGISNASGPVAAPWLVADAALGVYRIRLNNGSGAVVSAAPVSPARENLVEVLVTLVPDDDDDDDDLVTVQIHQRINGGVVTSGPVSAAVARPAAWSGDTLAVNNMTSSTPGRINIIPSAIRDTAGLPQLLTYLPGLPARGLSNGDMMDFAAYAHTIQG